MPESKPVSGITVLAGVNGAGKSSVGGARLAAQDGTYFNPDEFSLRIRAANPGSSKDEADSAAWLEGKRLLERAIAARLDYAFETTLGGETITALLEKAALNHIELRIWFVGLSSPELHIARVRSRVRAGGHDIPADKIRERYTRSRLNLIRLLPHLTELLVYDNSWETDPKRGECPGPRLILHMRKGKIAETCDLQIVPDWAKPIVAAASGR
jgi:predicted ABC-type ATPase